MTNSTRLCELSSEPDANANTNTTIAPSRSPACHNLHTAPLSVEVSMAAAAAAASSQPSSPCSCSHHYQYIQYHPMMPNRPSSPHYRRPIMPAVPVPVPVSGRRREPMSTAQNNDEMQMSGETHVTVTVHHHQPLSLPQPPSAQVDDDCSEDNKPHRNHLNAPPRMRKNQRQGPNPIGRPKRSTVTALHATSQIEVYSDGGDSGVRVTDGGTSEEDQGPPLPPRPPPRPVRGGTGTLPPLVQAPRSTGVKKYIVWCLICGGFSCLLGVMFLGVYFLLRSYTSTIGYFETVPTFVPATLLILTGLCIISLARRRNRYSYLIKLSGACGLVSALTCALVTVTTTVLHMSRLQALKECEYTQKTRTCTCYSDIIEPQMERVDEDCGVVHGSLYSCLRAIFGLSVAGVLVAVFSCMLVYQLLSHERKKMYWEQLELRCRSMYVSQQAQSSLGAAGGVARGNGCRCCEQCHAHRQTLQPATYPWDVAADARFWAAPGPQQVGNFYSPNPVGEDLTRNDANQRSNRSRWNWPRMPWQRSSGQTPSSPDSQYGFSSNVEPAPPENVNQGGFSVIGGVPYGVWGPPPPYSDPNSPARRGQYQYVHPNHCSNVLQMPPTHQPNANLECHQRSSSSESQSIESFCPQAQNRKSDGDGHRGRFSNTLPVRKTKKRVDLGVKSIGPMHNQTAQRVNVQNLFAPPAPTGDSHEPLENEYNEPGEASPNCKPASESEVYFGDVSSCCNMSVKNDTYYDDPGKPKRHHHMCKTAAAPPVDDDTEDYLAQRFGQREHSTRSRLPFPQSRPNDLPVAAPRHSLMQKEVSRQSMCSVESSEKTDFTDLSPATPGAMFVASLPYSSNEESQEALRRSTKSIHDAQQYEVIKEFDEDRRAFQAPRPLADRRL